MTKQKPKERWGKNGNGYKDQPVYKYIKEFGWENIEHIIIKTNIDKDEAKNLEKELIFQLDSIDFGYNIKKGGEVGSSKSMKILYDGKKYDSEEILQFSKIENLTSHDVTNRLLRGWDIKDVLEKPKIERINTYEYLGRQYSLKELFGIIKDKSISYDALKARLSNNWDIERAISQPTNKKNQPYGCRNKEKEVIYEYNGKEYTTHELLQLSCVPELTAPMLYNRIVQSGWSIDDALTKPVKKYNQKYELDGKLYTTKELLELSPLENLKLGDITDRIRQGWSIHDVVYKPKRKFKNDK